MSEYPTPAEARARRRTKKVAVRITPIMHQAITDKSRRTGIDVAWIMRRALELWIDGQFPPPAQ